MAASTSTHTDPPHTRGRTRPFDNAKQLLLEALSDGYDFSGDWKCCALLGSDKAVVGSVPNARHRGKDRSKKGSLDAPIVELVGLINGHPDYVTTSSCSGRIALFEDVDGAVCRKVRT